MNQDENARRKKVLFVVTKSNFGGAQHYVYDLATNLPVETFEPVVLCGVAEGKASAGVLIEKLAQANIRVIFIPELGRDVSARDFSAYRAISHTVHKERPDILHLNSSKAAGLGALAGRIHKVPRIIFTAHGWAFRESRNPLSRLAIYLISFLTVALSHRTICLSEYDRRPFLRFPFLFRKMSVVRNAIHRCEELSLPRTIAREHLAKGRVRTGSVWVGSVGELTANKNMRKALLSMSRALTADPDLFYVVLGDGEERVSLTEYAQELGISEYVHLVGHIPDAARFLPAFDIFFLPSLKEGLPYALLEAANAELPVVASSAGGIPEMIENGKSGIICRPSDTECFARGIVSLAKDENRRKEYARALKARVGGMDEFNRMVRETTALYL